MGDIDWTKSLSARRAWIEIKSRLKVAEMVLSLSARRAWIEILVVGGSVRAGAVALRKESVDRNHAIQHIITEGFESLSARRAWIEIMNSIPEELKVNVALRKESVDRNPRPCTRQQ